MPSTISNLAFRRELYREHLAEASFLYEHRLTLLASDEIEWVRVAGFEERFEAHIDALVVGGVLALEVCEEQALCGEPGELHAAVHVFCRQGKKESLGNILEAAGSEPERIAAAREALEEFPSPWREYFGKRLGADLFKFVPSLATCRQSTTDLDLRTVLTVVDHESLPAILSAIGHTRDMDVADSVSAFLENESQVVRREAIMALLRLGSREAQAWLGYLDSSEEWILYPLALGGGPSAVDRLLSKFPTAGCKKQFFNAFALLGDVRAVDALIDQLNNPEIAEDASVTLDFILGASSAGPIPSEKKRSSSKAQRARSKEHIAIRNSFADRSSWQKWWSENKDCFVAGKRYRRGIRISPLTLFDDLKSSTLTCKRRAGIYDELIIRYGAQLPQEPALMRVNSQVEVLSKLGDWVNTGKMSFQEGEWYFSGEYLGA